MIVNSEWGGFSAPSLPRVAADEAVDAQSVNPGAQTFEKLISGLYLGRITVLTLLQADAEAESPVFGADARAVLARADSFSTPLVAAVERDRCAHARERASAPDCARLTCVSPALLRARQLRGP
jgi:hexokinase